MANINEYITWRGDLSFEQSPFNEVDGLILAYLSYVPFEGIVTSPWEEDRITIREACNTFWEEHVERMWLKSISLVKMAPFVMRRLAATKRYGSLQLCYFQNSVILSEESQFSAFCVELPGYNGNEYYIVYRGTDSSIIGWKENLKMSYEIVPAQRKAVEYLNYIGKKIGGDLYVGGHSKGGNLATYAAAMSKSAIKRRIQGIYNYDGPGFMDQFLQSEEYQSIEGIYHKLVPTDSVVGMLLGHDDNYEIVECEEPGLRQHDPLSWRVHGTSFPKVTQRTKKSCQTEQRIRNCINDLSTSEKTNLIETLFQAFEEDELLSMNELRDIFQTKKSREAWILEHRKLRDSKEMQKLIKSASREFRTEFGRMIFPGLRHLR